MSVKMISFPSSLVTAPRLALVIGCLVPVKIKPQKRKVRHKHAAVLTAGPDVWKPHSHFLSLGSSGDCKIKQSINVAKLSDTIYRSQ